MTRRLAAVVALAAVLALAGCIGGGGDGDGASTGTASEADTSQQGQQGQQGADATEPGNETEDVPEGPYWNVTFTNATVSGTNAVVSFGEPLGDPNEHFFNVTQGARNLTLNFTAHDGELYVTIYEPGCDGGSSCSHRADTGGIYHQVMGSQGTAGESSWSTQNPATGMWRIQIYKGDMGSGSVDYTIEHAILQPRAS